MAKDLTNRLTSLGRAHDLVRPLPGHQGKAALLGDLLAILLSPYEDMGAFSGRIRVSVPRMGVGGENSATTLALVIHELATNSVKYGALSSDEGTLDLSGSLEGEDLSIVWMERGGPTIDIPAAPSGYGSGWLTEAWRGQLGGSIKYNWEPDGLNVGLTIKAKNLAN